MTLAPTLTRQQPVKPLLQSVAVAPTSRDEASSKEEKRWLALLLPLFAIGAAFFAAAVGTGTVWLIGPAIGIGVMCLIFAFIYLILTSDSN
jgi:type IV secretory pathway VirB6-like protein